MRPPPPRELGILSLIANGEDRDMVARRYHINVTSVKNSLERTREGYGTDTTPGAVAVAAARGHITARSKQRYQKLTPRERDVLVLVAHDFKYGAIATKLSISLRTVEGTVASIKRKFRAANIEQMVLIGCSQGIVPKVSSERIKKPLPTETEILIALSQHESVEEAAHALLLAPSTVKRVATRTIRRLRAKTVPHALATAIRKGEVYVPPTRHASVQLDLRETSALHAISHGADVAKAVGVSTRQARAIVDSMLKKLKTKYQVRAVFLGFQYGLIR